MPYIAGPNNIEDVYPMSDISKGMIYYSLKDTSAFTFHGQQVLQLKDKDFNIELLEKAFALLMGKHPILRTGFKMFGFDEPVQIVYKKIPLDIKHYNISHLDKQEQEEYLGTVLAEDRQKPFDVSAAEPMWRVKVFSLDSENIIFVWICHHAMIDGWSSASLITELHNTYMTLKIQPGFVPGKLKSTYKDFVIEQIKEKRKASNIEYWRSELAGYEKFKFPGAFRRNDTSNKEKRYVKNLGAGILNQLTAKAKKYKTSVKHLCFGAYIYMLNMISYENDMVVGLVTNNRPLREDGEKVIGCFLNAVPVRIKIPSPISWREYITLIDRKLVELKTYDRLALFEIVRIIGEEGAGQNPIFDALFNFMDFHVLRRIHDSDIRQSEESEELSVEGSTTINTLFNFRVNTSFGEFFITIAYADWVISPEMVVKLCEYFEGILNKMLFDIESIAEKGALIPMEEKKCLLYEFNHIAPGGAAGSIYPRDKTLHQLFETQAAQIPDTIALVYEDKQLTYNLLNEKANQLARSLRHRGTGPGSVVGLILERSLEMIVGIMAVLKAGGAYLPINPGDPGARRALMLDENEAAALLSRRDLAAQNKKILAEFPGGNIFFLDDESVWQGDTSNLEIVNEPDELVYVIYTSGTTGKPNGVMVEHRNVCHFVYGYNRGILETYGKPLNICMVSPYSFDGSVKQIFAALLLGHCLNIVPENTRMDGSALLRFYSKYEIDISDGTPAHIYLMLESLKGNAVSPGVKHFIIAGDILSPQLVKDFWDYFPGRGPDITNAYGPTECCTVSTFYHLSKDNIDLYNTLPVGSPLPHERVYILDKGGEMVPTGGIGEICIAGDGVTRGYRNREALTAGKFAVDPFFEGQRMYCTGDLGRWLPEGNIDFLGRMDDQVKVRGFRIELEEIQRQLIKHQDVKTAVVFARKSSSLNRRGYGSDDNYLCAYFISDQLIEDSQLRRFLSAQLPEYMVPTYFIPVERIPLTVNGKVDKKALPEPEIAGGEGYTAPRNEFEEKLAEIWSQVLGIEKDKIGIDSDFFRLGGHSLNAAMLTAKIHKELNVKIPLAGVFQTPTVRELAKYIKENAKDQFAAVKPAEEKEYYSLSSAQKRLYILHELEPNGIGYNMPRVIPLSGAIEKVILEETFKKIINRHEIFRTSFVIINEEPVQKIEKNAEFLIDDYELEPNGDKLEAERQVEAIVNQFVKSFDLRKTPLLRVGLIKVKEKEIQYLMIVDMHHIISDGTSMRILVNEFMALYNEEELPSLRLQYKCFVEWQNSEKQKKYLKQQELYWINDLSGELPVLDLPIDYERPLMQSFDGSSLDFELNEEKVQTLKKIAKQTNVTQYIFILSVFTVFLSKFSGQEDIVIGTPIAARRHADLEHIIGMFVNTLAMRNYPSGEQSFKEFLLDVKERTIKAFENQEYQFDDLIDKIAARRDTSRNPIFDVMFALDIFEPEHVAEEREDFTCKSPEDPFQSQDWNIVKTSKFDISLRAIQLGEKLLFNIEYCIKLFKKETIERFITYFKNVFSSLLEAPQEKLRDIEMISEEEKRKLLYNYNDTAVAYPWEKPLYQLFEEEASKAGDKVAVIFQDAQITYRALNREVNRLACVLRTKKVMPGNIVGILLERCIQLIISILSVLKVGGVYLPLNTLNPAQRTRYILEDSGARLLLTGGSMDLSPAADWSGEVLEVNININSKREYRYSELAEHRLEGTGLEFVNPLASLAYVVYTSGSTGPPKGVMVLRSGYLNAVYAYMREYRLREMEVILLQLADFTFDVSAGDIARVLANCGEMVICPEEFRGDVEKLYEVVRRHHITMFESTPALIVPFMEYIYENRLPIDNLELIILGADVVSLKDFKNLVLHFGNGMRIYNTYGVTEATIETLFYEGKKRKLPEVGNVPIGKPLANMKVYILDRWCKPVPSGVVGELYIGGKGVAGGYLNNPELTAEKFIYSHSLWFKTDWRIKQGYTESGGVFRGFPMGCIYRTGDRAKWLRDGNIEFLGRMDNQVKIRGFRVEMGEIESRLLNHDEIREVVVVAQSDERGDRYLCAYIVSDTGPAVSQLREYLAKNLPDCMIPGYFISIEKIPLTPNGKIDRKALSAPVLKADRGYIAPRTALEKKLADLWSEVLGIEKDVIGIHSNFFELGGHSLKATSLLAKMHKELNVKLTLAEIFKTPNIRGIFQYIKSSGKNRYAVIPPAEEKKYYVLSSAQKRLYILQRMDLNSTGYNMTQIIPLNEPIDKEKLEDTFKKLINRHESFRTSFVMINETPVQKINNDPEFTIDYHELGRVSHGVEARGQVEEIASKFIKPFELSKAPLLRVRLIKEKERQYLLLADMHHIISDGISMEILIKEFMSLYDGEKLPQMRLQYKDYAEWQNCEEQRELLRQQELYWIKEFSDELPVLNLPTDYPRPLMQSFEGSSVNFVLTEKETQSLREFAREANATLYMSILSVYTVLFSKLSGQEDIVVGAPIAARSHADLEHIIGMFVNTLAMRNYPSGEQTFKEFLLDVKERTIKNFENQEYQFEDLVDKVLVRRDTSRNPIFDVMFNLLNQAEYSGDIPPVDEQQSAVHQKGTSKFDLNLTAVDMGERLFFNLEYSTRLFKPTTIERIIGYFKKLLLLLSLNTELKLADIEIITGDEKEKIIKMSGGIEEPYNDCETIHRLFEKQVERTPDNIAVVGPSVKGRAHSVKERRASCAIRHVITYRELNKKSNQLANILKERGVTRDIVVGLMVERSVEMIIGILAILKAGGAYLPIDTEYPEERKKYMLKDSGVKLLLTDDELEHTPAYIPPDIEIIDPGNEYIYGGDGTNPRYMNDIRGADLVYVIYTSGSTGKPKGVMLEHQNLVNLIKFQYKYTNIDNSRILQFATISFDASFHEIFSAFLTGGELFLVDRETRANIAELFAFIGRDAIKTVFLPMSFLKLIFREEDYENLIPGCLEHIQTAGEQVIISDRFKKYLHRNHVYLHNHYGPSETHVVTTLTLSPDGEIPELPSIGKPILNTGIFILDKEKHLVPVGVPGELYIGGVQVGRGYLGKEELTLERFISSPFGKGERLYRTGDLTRWLSDGNCEFLGRVDYQVKIRGFRVEMGEIENRLLKYDGIKEVVVAARSDERGDKYLCAYIVADTEPAVSQLREYLAKDLPDYMVPGYFISVEKIPLTPSGKIDRKALPAPELKVSGQYIAPRTPLEKELADLWSEILGIDKDIISINNNFFELGGNSLKATILVAKVHKELNIKLTFAEVFKAPNIRGMSEYIKRSRKNRYAAMPSAEQKKYYALSSAQKRLYILQELDPDGTGYNMPQVISLDQHVEKKTLEDTFRKLINRHESLRTSFVMINEEPVQEIENHWEFKIEYYEFGDREDREQVEEEIVTDFVKPFDFNKAPLLRVGLIKVGETRYLLFVDMHHIISDGTSMEILINEFMSLYDGEKLPSLRLQYKDYAEWQNREEQRESLKQQESYWMKEFSDELPVLNLPIDYPRPLMQSFAGNSVHFVLTEKETHTLKEMTREANATLNMYILSVYTVLLSKLSGQEDIVVGTPIAARRHADLEQVIGMFVNTLAIRNYPTGEKSFKEFMFEVKNRTIEAFENQEYQFEDLVDKVSVRRDTSRNPIFDVMFNLLNQDEYSGDIAAADGQQSYIHRKGTSKFDMNLTAVEIGKRIFFNLEYGTRLFKPATIGRIIGYFKKILSLLPVNPALKLSDIELITEAEKQQILVEFNDTKVGYSSDKRIHELFAAEVEKRPDRAAVVETDSNHLLSYNALNEKTNVLARVLRERGAKNGGIAAIMLGRSLEMVIGIFAVLKAGGAYLPIEPDCPEGRIKYILSDSGAKLLLGKKRFVTRCPYDVELLSVEEIIPDMISDRDKDRRENIETTGSATDLAYVIYTSGSTGKPKGVLVEHDSVVNVLFTLFEAYHFWEDDVYLFKTSYTFDVSVSEIFGWFLGGGKLAILERGGEKDARRILDTICREGVSHINFVPSMFNVLVESLEFESVNLAGLKYLFLAGEALPGEMVRRFRERNDRIILENIYGPTEATIYAAKFSLGAWDGTDKVPIGRPLNNIKLYILDKWNHLQPIGIGGELCISGVGLARGYLNRPGLTAEKFILAHSLRFTTDRKGKKVSSFGKLPMSYLYKTGDLACWLVDGNIEYIGRIDHQVKIRGFRVEMGEIESRLLIHNEIKEVVVAARSDERGDKYLCAYIVADTEPALSEFREYLANDMPDYMIPAYFIPIEKIPLTPNGKIDRKALPAPILKADRKYIAPRTALEKKLADLWSEILRIEKDIIGIHSNFFELGGHSLKATLVMSRLFQEFSVRVPLVELFKKPTIRYLAGYIRRAKAREAIAPIEDDNLVLLKENADKADNLFFIHDGSGEVDSYIEFCSHLANGYNCWGIRAVPFKDYAPRKITIEETAETYIKIIKGIQPRGPYNITGWSMGGTIAFEMVRWLEQMKEKIGFFAMIDVVVPYSDLSGEVSEFTLESELEFVREYLLGINGIDIDRNIMSSEGINGLWSSVIEYLQAGNFEVEIIKNGFIGYEAHVIPAHYQQSIGELIRYLNMRRAFHRARASYMPRGKINTPVYYFGASQSKGEIYSKWDIYSNKPIKYYEVTGDHYSIMKMPGVLRLAKLFGKVMKEAGKCIQECA
jgi:tyrocidine synthetase-3